MRKDLYRKDKYASLTFLGTEWSYECIVRERHDKKRDFFLIFGALPSNISHKFCEEPLPPLFENLIVGPIYD